MAGNKSILGRLEKKAEALVLPTVAADGTVGVVGVQVARKRLMTPCATPEAFKAWLKEFCDLDFPDQQIDPDSTGSPFDEFWRIYHAMVTNDITFPRRNLLYASRASYKTLGVSLLELVGILHGDRSVVHCAAIEDQAAKAQSYLRAFLSREELSEFAVGNNKRSVAVVWARHKKTGDFLTNDEYRALDRVARRNYFYHANYAKVIVNTMTSSNSEHTAMFVVDEIDLIRFPLAYAEAKLIPETQTSAEGIEQPPITILTSSRKFSGGLVQKEIDEAETTGTAIRHWNILDVCRRCPDEKHRPDLEKVDVFIANDELRVIKPEEYEALAALDAKKAEDYRPFEVFNGCLNNCPERVCAGCKGVLAGVTSQAKMLKGLDDVIAKFREVSMEMVAAQLMCWKPGNEASIFKNFSRKHHMLTLGEMWEIITGDEPPKFPVLTKERLVEMLMSRKVKWAMGVDFGFTHNFAVCLFAIDGRRAFLIDAFEVAQLELNQKVELCDKRFKAYKKNGLIVWPDPAYPSDIKTFRMKGYTMKTHTKDVLGGINVVRNKLNPANGHEPELFMLKGDTAGDLMASRIESYRWVIDSQGRSTDVPNDLEDDMMDALRYVISNEFRGAGKVVVGKKDFVPDKPVVLTPQTWMAAKIAELTNGQATEAVATRRVRRGGFFADFSG